jgi:hypothetical protein
VGFCVLLGSESELWCCQVSEVGKDCYLRKESVVDERRTGAIKVVGDGNYLDRRVKERERGGERGDGQRRTGSESD